MLKKILILVLALAISMTGAINAFAAEDKKTDIEMSGKTIELSAKVWDGELFLPLRVISEELGYDVQWFGEKKEIKVSKEDKSINLSLSDSQAAVNGHEAYIPGGYRLVNDRTYLRQDFFSDNLKLKVSQDKVNNKIALEA
ncbi:MAG TPA: copper amine oxidase N-terminal domain-containing protein, partial [Patescibacteria group bacterium]|nr:copper amine oxidase N-terminal domain-containing protein [Patescibacteria group bacterium]